MWMEVVQRRDVDGRLHSGPDLMGEFNECVMIFDCELYSRSLRNSFVDVVDKPLVKKL